MTKFLEIVAEAKQNNHGGYIIRVFLTDGKKVVVLDEEGPFESSSAAEASAAWMLERASDTIMSAFNRNKEHVVPIRRAWDAPSPFKPKRKK